MGKPNVLLVGVSGAGKSTLVNGIAGKKTAKVTQGDAGTQEICKYEMDELEFNLIDTRGFEFNFINQKKTISDMRKLMKKGLAEDEDAEVSNLVNCIWYCVDATVGRLHKESIKDLQSVIKSWKDIPVIVILTKSYSEMENTKNIQMVKDQFAKYGKSINLQKIIPVVAEPYTINEGYTILQKGIEELRDQTVEVLEIADTDAAKNNFRQKQKRWKAQLLINATTVVSAAVAAIPIPIADNVPLTILETGMLSGIGKIYGLQEEGDDEQNVSRVFKMLLTAGTVGTIAKTAISAIKAIPGIGIAASILNSAMAVLIVELLGQTCIVLFEKIEAGELNLDKVNEIGEFIEKYVSENAPELIKNVSNLLEKNGNKINVKELISSLAKKG